MTASEIRAGAVRLIKSIAKRNQYTNGSKREKVFDGWGDCSSTVRKVLQKAGLPFSIGSNTNAQMKNRKTLGLVVDESTNGYPNEANLLPGDCLYFKGNIFHTLSVGHVEMYTGPNECYGHGSGIGPTKKNLREYCRSRNSKSKRYFMAIRWAFDPSERTLSKGMTGPDVTTMQKHLLALKYDLGKDGADGDFGSKTLAAVKAFQHDAGLVVDGIMDKADLAKLKEIAEKGWPVVEPPAPPESIPSYMCKWAVATADVAIRKGPGTQYGKVGVALLKGTGLMYDGETRDGWHAVLYRGKRHWVSGRYSQLEVHEKYIVDISAYDAVKKWATFSKYVSYVWIRVACRRLLPSGKVYRDSKFEAHAKACKAQGIPFGVYVFSRANTAARGIEEARKAAEWAEPYGPTTYVCDAETAKNTSDGIQAFVDEAERLTGKPCGAYIGNHVYARYKADKLRLAFRWIPLYRTNGGGTHASRSPSYPHDVHQYTSAGRIPGKSDDTDLNHITGTGRTIEWFRSGGKAADAIYYGVEVKEVEIVDEPEIPAE
jgi:GH25 family lysozyme M1 (1,4-beta-N-acetylmuramidase)